MEWIQSINKAIDYMETHLTEDIHCDDVVEVPSGFQIINIPAYTWAIFKCVGSIPDYDIENYLPGDNTAEDYVSEIWLPVRERA